MLNKKKCADWGMLSLTIGLVLGFVLVTLGGVFIVQPKTAEWKNSNSITEYMTCEYDDHQILSRIAGTEDFLRVFVSFKLRCDGLDKITDIQPIAEVECNSPIQKVYNGVCNEEVDRVKKYGFAVNVCKMVGGDQDLIRKLAPEHDVKCHGAYLSDLLPLDSVNQLHEAQRNVYRADRYLVDSFNINFYPVFAAAIVLLVTNCVALILILMSHFSNFFDVGDYSNDYHKVHSFVIEEKGSNEMKIVCNEDEQDEKNKICEYK
jgi:hypothetical protein